MPAKVFISCGQADQSEKEMVKTLSEWFAAEGFQPFVAIETQSIMDVNNIIIKNLQSSDYYVFIDLRRERLISMRKIVPDILHPRYRGSLFSHQELGIAYLLNFPEVLLLQEQAVKREGLLAYMLGNARSFNSKDEAIKMVQEEVKQRGWRTTFSRAFELQLIPLGGLINYGDHTTPPPGRLSRVANIRVINHRRDLPALNTTARLDAITCPNNSTLSPDSSPLKWAGEQAYNKLIFQGEEASFDAFGIPDSDPSAVYLHSASVDFTPCVRQSF